MRLSSTRWSMWCQTPREKLQNGIFGNGVLPEDCTDRITPSLILTPRFHFFDEGAVSGLELWLRLRFGADTAFGYVP